ncbi:MAG: ATP/GTP-binding protein [Nitrospinales bacterium]
MLIEFKVTNFRSIRETQTLSLVANSSKELLEENTFDTGIKGFPRLLRSVVIYGPNAAGKSNLCHAMWFMRLFVINSAQEKQAGDEIPATPFLFDRTRKSHPSEFEIIFIHKGIRYQYGFAINVRRIIHEWLLAYPLGKAQRWFERKFNPNTQRDKWEFGSKFKSRKRFLQEATRDNALFLSTAIQLNNEQLMPVFDWFNSAFNIFSSVHTLQPDYTVGLCEESSGKNLVIKFMNEADLSIANISLEKNKLSLKYLPKGMPREIKEQIRSDLQENLKIIFFHNVKGSTKNIGLDFGHESDGTQKLFSIACPILNTLAQGNVLVVDELDNSLHPLLVRYLINFFHDPKLNNKNSQLIFATHDTSLLDKEIFRRDQVWFVEKDKHNSTQLYPLSDFKPRKGEALAKGYLQGRYGALPFIGDFKI